MASAGDGNCWVHPVWVPSAGWALTFNSRIRIFFGYLEPCQFLSLFSLIFDLRLIGSRIFAVADFSLWIIGVGIAYAFFANFQRNLPWSISIFGV